MNYIKKLVTMSANFLVSTEGLSLMAVSFIMTLISVSARSDGNGLQYYKDNMPSLTWWEIILFTPAMAYILAGFILFLNAIILWISLITKTNKNKKKK